MTLFSGGDKEEARYTRDAWKRVSADATFAGAVTTAAAGVGATALGLSTALLAGPVAVTAAMVWYASRTVLAAERVAEDPERFDVDQVAIPRVVRLELDDLVEPVVLEVWSDRAFIRAADASFHALGALAGYGEAIVLAYERMRGADLIGRADAYQARSEELFGLSARLRAELGGSGMPSLVEPLAALAGELQGHPAREGLARLGVPPAAERPERLVDALPGYLQIAFFRAGMTVDPFLERVDWVGSGRSADPFERGEPYGPDDAFGTLAVGLLNAAPGLKRLARLFPG